MPLPSSATSQPPHSVALCFLSLQTLTLDTPQVQYTSHQGLPPRLARTEKFGQSSAFPGSPFITPLTLGLLSLSLSLSLQTLTLTLTLPLDSAQV